MKSSDIKLRWFVSFLAYKRWCIAIDYNLIANAGRVARKLMRKLIDKTGAVAESLEQALILDLFVMAELWGLL